MPDTVPSLPVPSSGGLTGLGNDANALAGILSLLFGGRPTNTSGTTTTGPSTTVNQNVVDPAAIEYTIRSMLEGSSGVPGLANILTNTQNNVGAYGSSSAAFFTNDLISRIVGQIANLTKANVTTNSGQTNTSSSTTQQGAQPGAKELAALAALKAALGTGKSQSGNAGASKGGGGGGASIKASGGGTSAFDKRNTDSDSVFNPWRNDNEYGKEDQDAFIDELDAGAKNLESVNTDVGINDLEVSIPGGDTVAGDTPFIDTDWDGFGEIGNDVAGGSDAANDAWDNYFGGFDGGGTGTGDEEDESDFGGDEEG